jgi:4a-hydroxytetrahydrobiopterin dehydratase
MPKPLPLSADELQALSRLAPEWRLDEGGLSMRRVFQFKDFDQAFGFMTEVARRAQQQDHHPNWTNVYSKVEVVLSTHEAGALTQRDQILALTMDQIWTSLTASILQP